MTRRFLEFHQPLIRSVCDVLFEHAKGRGRSMDHLLVVVPTRQANRRIREALAVRCAEEGGGLLAPRVITPYQLLLPDPSPPTMAGPLLVRATWADVLMRADLERLPHLFPDEPPPRTYAWALRMAAVLDTLRDELLDGGLGLIDVAEQFAHRLPEPDRWRDLAWLERAYLEALHRLDRLDPCAVKRRAAQAPAPPAGIERVIVACVPDLAPILRRALDNLADRWTVDVLVHAPRDWEGAFDDWGRPIPEVWERERLPISDEDIVLAGDEDDQSRLALDLLRALRAAHPDRPVAISAPDRAVVPYLARALDAHGIDAFDPAPRPIAAHRAVRLVTQLAELATGGRYGAASRLFRHPDVLAWLAKDAGVPAAELLEALDRFQNRTLPQTFHDLVRRVETNPDVSQGLAAAVRRVQDIVRGIASDPGPGGMLRALETVYGAQVVDPRREEDALFMGVAREITAALRDCEQPPFAALRLSGADRMTLLIEHLRSVRLNPERGNQAVDIEGWLELPWSDAPALVITGLNDGIVPESVEGDAFLSDTVRQRLGLRDNRDRFARDACLVRALVEARPRGSVRWIVGKANRAGDPLKPSRLLFLCPDEVLAPRAARLFGEPESRRPNVPATVSFRLDPALLPAESPEIDVLPVTAFKDYLACPFRFYLRRVLGMERLDDQKEELDPLDFGSLLHAALSEVLGDGAGSARRDAEALGNVLADRVQRLAESRWGRSLPLPVRIQLQSAQQRLRAAAGVHVDALDKGWELQDLECRIEGVVEGMRVEGRIDRIDRHRATGALRILDYKTAEQATAPGDAHLGPAYAHTPPYAVTTTCSKGRRASKAWKDLQLPLYLDLWRARTESNEVLPGVGFFHLPKAVNNTGIEPWEGLDEILLDSARACAAGIVRDIRASRFWPPAERVAFDECALLFPRPAADCVDPRRWLSDLAARAGPSAARPGEGRR